jgi:hypothetical protein
MTIDVIQKMIFKVGWERVLLDFDIAGLYGIETGELHEAIRQNTIRIPEEFMFRLKRHEWKYLIEDQTQSALVTISQDFRAVLPYAFTEHGVAMLACILKSGKSTTRSIDIIRAFIGLRKELAPASETVVCKSKYMICR